MTAGVGVGKKRRSKRDAAVVSAREEDGGMVNDAEGEGLVEGKWEGTGEDAEMEEVSKRQKEEFRERREKKAKKKRDEAQQRQSRKQSGIEAFLTRKPD